jgi:nucleotide-binding universal stress UspA family protein
MIKHLLVPLDGSPMAEVALPVASFLASCLGASITLVHVIEAGAPATVHGQRHLQAQAEAQLYLDEVAKRLAGGINVDVHVHIGSRTSISRSIVAHEGELEPDLIVMAAHGSGGVRDLLMGSIAQQVVAEGKVPVLVIRPGEVQAEPYQLQQILAPVDGHSEHEAGLTLAAELARVIPASLSLLLVLPNSDTLSARQRVATRLLPAATERILELLNEQAEEYINSKVAELNSQNIQAFARFAQGDPAENILRVAETTRPDLLVMGTHGKKGLTAYGESSVVNQVFTRLKVPLLLVPVREKP